MSGWTAFSHSCAFSFDSASVCKAWPKLHAGDAEPLPAEPAVLQAWALFHNGEFQAAAEAGLQAGGAGVTVANKACAIYANYLESREQVRLGLFLQVAERAERQLHEQPDNPNAWYWRAYALGRYGQGISVAKALAQGLGVKVRGSLERVIALSPRHVDAHIALGTFHAEVIDKVGQLVGGMAYGARKDVGLRMFREALRLHPASPIAMIEYARALLMLDGAARMPEATCLYEQAVAMEPADATECLDIALAEAELAD